MTEATTAAPDIPVGTVLDGMYTTGARVRTRVGAATYEATGPAGEKVSVTAYAADCFPSPSARERSLRELRTLESVDHPNVATVLDSGKLDDGGIYEVHEVLQGETLEGVTTLPAEQVTPLITALLAAITAALNAGVAHRNLGPTAVLRRPDGGIKVFGFAVGEPHGGKSHGSLECLAPEQIVGKNVSERTLLYNVAALIVRLLAGRPLFVGAPGDQLGQQVPDDSMHAVLAKALEKELKRRPKKLTKISKNLAAIVEHGVRLPPIDTPDKLEVELASDGGHKAAEVVEAPGAADASAAAEAAEAEEAASSAEDTEEAAEPAVSEPPPAAEAPAAAETSEPTEAAPEPESAAAQEPSAPEAVHIEPEAAAPEAEAKAASAPESAAAAESTASDAAPEAAASAPEAAPEATTVEVASTPESEPEASTQAAPEAKAPSKPEAAA
ncbi:MAG: hypothetical protein KC636_25650, partial [Myxococcales bacterium]|nr:hypothetical protein [Myxococcales bacterium]